jgi:hypothetical protein
LDGAGKSRLPFVEVDLEVAGEVEATETGVLVADSVTVDLVEVTEDLEAQEVVEGLEIEAAEVVVDVDSAIVTEDEDLVPTDVEEA